jgi:hypothetical protein
METVLKTHGGKRTCAGRKKGSKNKTPKKGDFDVIKCSKCLIEKNKTAFYKGKTNSWCKQCQLIYAQQYRAKNKEKLLSTQFKICRKCGIEKNFNFFVKTNRDFFKTCRSCREDGRRFYEINKNKYKTTRQIYFKEYYKKRKISGLKTFNKGKYHLSSNYIKRILIQRTNLNKDEIPNSLIRLERIHLKIKIHLKTGTK